MKRTSVQITPNAGSISAEGSMGEYGQTYVTYNLTPDANGKGGLVLAEGRGALKNGKFAIGTGAGSYYRETFSSLCIFCFGSTMAPKISIKLFSTPQVAR